MSDQTTAPTLDVASSVEAKRVTIPRHPHPVVIEAAVDVDGKVSMRSPGLTMIFDQAPVALDGKAATIPAAGHMRVMAYVDSSGLVVSLKLDGHGMWRFAEHLSTEGVRVEVLV